jgi:vesicle-associated membrane protein-associated protein A
VINGRSALPIPEFDDTRDHASFEETNEDADPAPVVNVAVHHAPPPRQQTPQPSREHDLDEKLGEATAEINRLRALLADMPKPESKEESRSEPSGVRRRHRSPSTVTGTETEVSSYVDEPYQPEGVPLQIVIIIALGVFVTTYLFF